MMASCHRPIRDGLSVALLGLACLCRSLVAQDAPDKKSDPPDVVAAREHVSHLVLEDVKSKKPIERVEKPVLVYGDAARASERGSLWAFGKSGRPAALVELFQMKDQAGTDLWIYGLTRTADADVRLRLPADSDWTWTPPKSDLVFKPLPEADAPASTPSARLRQMKEASRRFAAHEFWEPGHSRFELRLLVAPIHRYEDPAKGIVDGAVFVFAHGTNPEVTLFLEAVKTAEKTEWQYALGRSCQAEFHVLLDEKEVHTGPRLKDSVGDKETVWLGSRPVATPIQRLVDNNR